MRQIGVLVLEALMVVFVFAYSWSHVSIVDKHAAGKLTISAAVEGQFVFRDSQSSSESLLADISKIQLSDGEFGSFIIDLHSLKLATCDAFFVTPALYNTFYTNTTIHAP